MRQRGRRIHPVSTKGKAPAGTILWSDRCQLCGPDVLAAGSRRALAVGESHGLAFAQLVEGHLLAGGLVEEILVAVRCGDKAESLVPDEPLDRAVASSHVVSPRCTLAEARRARMVVKAPRLNRRGLQADAE